MDILHRVGIKSSSLDETYKALTTREGLAAWWTHDTQGESKIGGLLQFGFSAEGVDIGRFEIKVLELDPPKRVLWEVLDGAARMDRYKNTLGAKTGRRLHHRPLQTPGLEGNSGVDAPLQPQMGNLSDELEVAFGNG